MKWDIVGNGEIRRRGRGFETQKADDLFYYLGEPHESIGGLEFFIKKRLSGNHKIVQPVSTRIIYVIIRIYSG